MSERGERRRRWLPGAIIGALAVGLALQLPSLSAPTPAPSLVGQPSTGEASAAPHDLRPTPTPSASTPADAVTAVTLSKAAFAQDALVDPVLTGSLTGAGGVRVQAQVWADGGWVDRDAVVADAQGRFTLPLTFGHAEIRTDRWRLVAGGVTSQEISVKRMGIVRHSVRTPTRADVQHSWREGCPAHYSKLRIIDVNYYGFDGKMHRGQLVVHHTVVKYFVDLLQNTIDNRFPIHKMQSIEAYQADDHASAADNNTSAFNCRKTTGGSTWSEHTYGVAIDINPVQNPYVDGQIIPPAGKDYLDRKNVRPGMLTADSPVIKFALKEEWAWLAPTDYQHLEW